MTDLPTYLNTPFYNYYFEDGEETTYKVDKLESFFEMLLTTYQAERGDFPLSAFPVDHNYTQTLAYWHILKNTDKLRAIKYFIEEKSDFATWLIDTELKGDHTLNAMSNDSEKPNKASHTPIVMSRAKEYYKELVSIYSANDDGGEIELSEFKELQHKTIEDVKELNRKFWATSMEMEEYDTELEKLNI